MRPLGILMLDTRFPRIAGDIGNPASFSFPVIYERLEGIGPPDAVSASPDRARISRALAANARRLAQRGAVGVATSCGFLALFQAELAAVSPIPVATSALLLVPQVARTLPAGRRVGVLTANAASLTPAHLAAAGAPADTPVAGMPPRGAFAHTFLGDAPDLDRDAVEREALKAGQALVARHPGLGAVVLECTNLPPYAAALRRALGLPVYDVLDLLRLFRAGLPG
ncbi:aspartate/glutamate racemase family protein [Vineibacter terrae]|uniref:aspartate/glutamate racemase family protein n=1 Tax=Vineibacter terrae TaxID=2586908 RepID=UPI002E3606F7|nr:aspartate/glutamate racemase family protein [Vineibacter terrae]HEX2891731.1 aspartate/glutamate racemase family protein [Vineibacter terrae]